MKAKGWIGFVLAACGGVTAFAAHAQESYAIRGQGYEGCKSKQVLTELRGHLARGDKATYSNALAGANMNGKCTMFKNGEQVVVIGVEVDSKLAKVRRRGEAVQYWTNLKAVSTHQN